VSGWVPKKRTGHHETVTWQKQKRSDTRMSRRARVAQRKRDTVKKNLTQGTGGPGRKRLVAANKKMTRCANVTQCKRLRLQGIPADTIKYWTLWKGRPPPKQKKKLQAEEEPVI
jgi:hypothetical protein